MAGPRCVFLAVDAPKSAGQALATIRAVMDGPMAPYLAGVKVNDALHGPWGGPNLVQSIRELWPGIGIFVDLKIADVDATVLNTINRYGRRLSMAGRSTS